MIVLHGSPGDPESVREQTRMDRFAQEHGVLVAYPEGHVRRWRPDPELDQIDDVGFLTTLVGRLIEQWHADPGRIYAAGYSNGAAMSWRLAAEAAGTFAAVAPVSGSMRRLTGPASRGGRVGSHVGR